MIFVNDISRKKTYILNEIEALTHQPYLKQFINTPVIDKDKIFLLVAMSADIPLEEKTVDQYIITTTLVQIALDIHEEVSVTTNIRQTNHKEQQLKVLAGDYYSGLYYHMLSQIDDIDMIGILANSIKRINEHKIRIYRQDLSYNHSIVESLKIVESDLIRNIANSFTLNFWSELVPEILLLKRLYSEKNRYRKTGQSTLIEYLMNELFQEEDHKLPSRQEIVNRAIVKVDLIILNTRESIDHILTANKLDSPLIDNIQKIINSFEHTLHQTVEER